MDNEYKGYPKYQYSVFLKNGQDAQLVIRADSWEEFKKLKENLNLIIEKHKPVTADNDVTQRWVETPETKFCAVHGAQMQKGISKKTNKPYWYHQIGEDRCFGKGVPQKQETQEVNTAQVADSIPF